MFRSITRLLLACLVVAAFSALAMVATAAFGTSSHRAPSMQPTHRGRLTRAARAADASFAVLEQSASGDVPALQVAGIQVFASQEPDGNICVSQLNPDGSGGMACGHQGEVTKRGVALVSSTQSAPNPRVTVLVPNGVGTVTFSSTNGQPFTATVSNNVATYSVAGLKSASYQLPDGATESLEVPTQRFAHN